MEGSRPVVFFDIDNTLYSASAKISQAMGVRIHDYFLSLGFPEEEASALHLQYYTKYGLALRGLARHHDVDPLDFDRKCDGSLPLEEMIRPDASLRQLFLDIDRSKLRVWALTNAYKTHAERVLRILNLDDQVEGVVFCDYAQPDFSCKPEPRFYQEAIEKAGSPDPTLCYFIDDNRINIDAASNLGWGHCVHFCERGLEVVEGGKIKQIDTERLDGSPHDDQSGVVVIDNLQELRVVWKDIFKSQ